MTSIRIPKHFRDRWFSGSFGKLIQEPIRLAGDELAIDFSHCEWIDPLPMLALICHVKMWEESVGPEGKRSLTINLGRNSTRPEDFEKCRPRLFLASHGFLRAIFDVSPDATIEFDSTLPGFLPTFKAKTLPQLDDAISVTAKLPLRYGSEPACPPMLMISGHDQNEVAQFVDRAVKTMDSALFSGRQSTFLFRDSALVRVRQVATEIVLNAYEHAYEASVNGPIALYARLRHHNDHSVAQDAQIETTLHCPLIDKVQEVPSGQYIEVFICDVGRGLSHHSAKWSMATSDEVANAELVGTTQMKPGNQRSQNFLAMAFRWPVSRHKRGSVGGSEQRSNVTGLRHVNTVLTHQRDRSRLFVSPFWTASGHPRPQDYNCGAQSAYFAKVKAVKPEPLGTFFHFGIAITNSEVPLEGWLVPTGALVADDYSSQLPAAFRDRPSSDDPKYSVFDLAQSVLEHRKSGGLKEVVDGFNGYLVNARGVAIIRMSRDFRKNLTDGLVAHWFDRQEALEATTLAFCDLSRAEAVLLSEHLMGLLPGETTNRALANKQASAKILILSEDLTALELVLGADARKRRCFIRNPSPDARAICEVVRTLRRFDSTLFWTRVGQRQQQLLIANVRWNSGLLGDDELRLNPYLDYAMAVQDREVAKVVRRALRRLLAAFPGANAIAIDELIKPDLADASRWMSRPLRRDDPSSLFVISSVVTGTTVQREARFRGIPHAVVACFRVAATPAHALDESQFQYFTALEWSPPAVTAPTTSVEWEREPGTPFVRSFVPGRTDAEKRRPFLKPIARNLIPKENDDSKLPSAADSYNEWHRDNLLKVGHWSIDRRHGLVELDHLGALRNASDSSRGFYEWLAAELANRSKGVLNPILIYPPGRLNAVMVRHLSKLRDEEGEERFGSRWQFVPINFLPDIGDGLKRLTALSEKHIGECVGARGGTVFFLDIGFVGNRTFRHTRRQLMALGVSKVIGLGLVNRSSSPALLSELKSADVQCYWRLDVPTLDDERSCPICGGLKAMNALLERARSTQSIIAPAIDQIFSNWQLTDAGQKWNEHGLQPIRISTPISKKFGFSIPKLAIASVEKQSGQVLLLAEDGAALPATSIVGTSLPSKDDWRHVWLRDSAQAVTYAIEIARTQSAPLYPLRFAQKLVAAVAKPEEQGERLSAALEVLTCYLLLCAHELTIPIREAVGIQILRNLAGLEGSASTPTAAGFSNRDGRLRELAGIALVNLDGRTKRLLLDEVVSLIESTRILSPETRVAIMAVIMEPASIDVHASNGRSRFDDLVNARLGSLASVAGSDSNTLRWNYWQLTITEQLLSAQYERSLSFFGVGKDHGDSVKRLKQAENDTNTTAGWRLCQAELQSAYTQVCRKARDAMPSSVATHQVGELFSALCPVDPDVMQKILELSKQAQPDRYIAALKEATRLIKCIRQSFHSAMFRVEPDAMPSVLEDLKNTIQQCLLNELSKERFDAEVSLVSKFDDFKLPLGARYILFGTELKGLISGLAVEALEAAAPAVQPPPDDIKPFGAERKARLWVCCLAEEDGNISVQFWNSGGENARANDFRKREPDLASVHQKLKTSISRQCPVVSGVTWYCTKIVFRWIQGGGV